MSYMNCGSDLYIYDLQKPWENLDNETFENYWKERFQNEYLEKLDEMVRNRLVPIGRTSQSVPEPASARVSGLTIHSIQFGMGSFPVTKEYPRGYPMSGWLAAASASLSIQSAAQSQERQSYRQRVSSLKKCREALLTVNQSNLPNAARSW